jgi:hypothetical protein
MEKNIVAKKLLRIAKELLSENLPTDSEVASFLFENQNPSDDVVHKWAEENEYNVHKVEQIIYKLATKTAVFLTNGFAKEKGIKREDVDPEQLAMGIEVEKEHTPDEYIAERIALDHIAELPNYYTLLKDMEEDSLENEME